MEGVEGLSVKHVAVGLCVWGAILHASIGLPDLS